eukprot:3124276-Alexandrium_andersonii.AAC.1
MGSGAKARSSASTHSCLPYFTSLRIRQQRIGARARCRLARCAIACRCTWSYYARTLSRTGICRVCRFARWRTC